MDFIHILNWYARGSEVHIQQIFAFCRYEIAFRIYEISRKHIACHAERVREREREKERLRHILKPTTKYKSFNSYESTDNLNQPDNKCKNLHIKANALRHQFILFGGEKIPSGRIKWSNWLYSKSNERYKVF